MFTVQDFVSKYEQYTDAELLEVYSNPDGYSDIAKQAFAVELRKKAELSFCFNA